MAYIHTIVLLAVIQYYAFGVLVGRARGQYGVKAPAVSGHPMFERALRVQMNTLEQMAAFLPALLVAGQYWPPAWVAGLGAVYLVGRQLYARSYMADPDKRGPGFGLTAAPTAVLVVLGLVGAWRGA